MHIVTDDPRLRSTYYAPAQLMALGRIAELSALLEVLLRNVLGQVLGLGPRASEALFLGDPANAMVARMNAVAKFADAPGWFVDEGYPWAKRVGRAIEERNDVLHRAPVVLSSATNEDDHQIGWNVSRRKHKPVPIDDDRLLALIEQLYDLEREAMDALMWGRWERAITDPPDGASTPAT